MGSKSAVTIWATPPTAPTGPRDNRAWLAHWSDQLLKAIAAAIADPTPTTCEDFRLQWAVHCARIVHGRALKVRPSLRPVDITF